MNLIQFTLAYWQNLTANEFSFVARGPVAAGMGVVNVTYGLCPDVSIGEIVRQVRAAIFWARENARTIGCDPEKIIVAGHSAGAHLAAMSAFTDWEQYGLPPDTIKGVLAISGIFDLEPIAYSFLQPVLQLTAEAIRWQSPLRHIRRIDTPFVVASGTAEIEGFTTQSQRFSKAMSDCGNTVSTLPLDGCNHFDVLDSLYFADGVLTKAAVGLLAASR